MGAYGYVKPRIETAMREIKERHLGEIYFKYDEADYRTRDVHFVGRRPSAAPANGGFKEHISEQKEILDRVLDTSKPFDRLTGRP